ncbi:MULTISPECIES: SDR family oxidoreductase [unclassified Beijerinckia]|uniref:SDR family oxidoreductase n=1 Tax=unclassified Beijerinckia TaxID=2638183 RepID=UPI00089AE708|nr:MULTISPECIES: SDR family oxidoreductase [unclassified Beijerinckia]MDH7795196.1 NAD(P)-dependent dehydrogenase (short-subunit alcohol dehydrogenase family) [Beijerinckia sp. GAS462]SEB91592.1 NAD(P)-dependent dehydrogenase, short-chain alcohol dehydrogenase family [Beijerinckia sp. 28-YEA-48]
MLNQRIVLITGAARGVGKAIALACARAGAQLILADILTEEGEQTAAEIRATGTSCRFLRVDLADPQSITAMGQNIAATEERLDGLVNNAAIATNVGGAAFEDIDIDLWDRVMRVNIRGTWLVTKAASPLLSAGAQVVNLASDTALWGPPRLLAYVTSKGAIISMTRSLSRELGARRIGVVGVAPGIMRNEATDYVPAERHQEYERGRAVPGPQMPEDITEAIVFLLTPHALCFTGQVLPVDAGFVFT